jgi:hypothetical protein
MTCLNSGKRPRRVLFVLGSGVSIPVCPNVTDLTKSIFEPGRMPYEWGFSNSDKWQERDAVIGYLSVLRSYIRTAVFRPNDEPNYEDLYSLCLKLEAYELSSRPEPGLTLFRDFISRATKSFSGFYKNGGYLPRQPLAAISARSRQFIVASVREILRGRSYDEDLLARCLQLESYGLSGLPDSGLTMLRDFKVRARWDVRCDEDVLDEVSVVAMIAKVRESFCGRLEGCGSVKLDCILDTIREYGPGQVDVLTLNHDLLLENALDREGMQWTDGFDKASPGDENAFQFDRGAFRASGRVRILKIHGGCDWCPGSVEGDEWQPLKLRRGAKRELYCPDYELSLTLTGSTTKGDAYTRGVFGDLNWEARRLLREHNRIVCSGYGWKDEAFNAMLKDWSDSHEDARMLLLHDEGRIEEFEVLHKPWLWPDGWKTGSGWLKWHPKWLSDPTLCDLDEFCIIGGRSHAPRKRSKSQ